MAYSKSRSPLVIRSGKKVGSVCSFSFYVSEGGVRREALAANAYSIEIAKSFILRWQEEGGTVIDLRSPERQPLAQPLHPQGTKPQSLRVRHRSNLHLNRSGRSHAGASAF